MKIKSLQVFFVLSLVLLGCSQPTTYQTPFSGSYSQKILFAHGLDQTLGLFDPEGGTLYPHVENTEVAPNHLAFSQDSLFVTNSLSGSIQKFSYDPQTGLLFSQRLFLGDNKNPWMIIPLDPLGISPKAYIPCYASNQILIISLSPLALTNLPSIPTGKNPQSGAIMGSKLYVGNISFDDKLFQYSPGTITVVDTFTDQVISTITLDSAFNPQSLIPFPGLNQVHVVCTGIPGKNDGVIVIIDTLTDEIVNRLLIGGSPSWHEGGLDPVRKEIYLSGIGGIQAYNYETSTILGTEYPSQGYFLIKGDDTLDDLWSGAFYDKNREKLYLCRSGENKFLQYTRVGAVWVTPLSWDTLNYPQGNFILLP